MHNKATDKTSIKLQLMKALQSVKTKLESSNADLVQHVRNSGTLVDIHAETYDKLEKREEAMIKCIDDLESHVQENSQLAVEQHFGTGPYQVELMLRTKVHMRRIRTQTIVFELAPLNLMPHSVHHFLRMLSVHVWEGMVFMPQKHVPHRIQASPVDMTLENRIQASPVDMETLEPFEWRFENAKLKTLIFHEHSSDYKCGSYSLGFSGNPGGPDFYINGLDTPEEHANDSCFGKVVHGMEIIESIIQKQESPILGIESMRLLSREETKTSVN